jgi:hypothetical protein
MVLTLYIYIYSNKGIERANSSQTGIYGSLEHLSHSRTQYFEILAPADGLFLSRVIC